jgi:hypothetical protein
MTSCRAAVAAPFLILGTVWVVTGGLVAAAIAPDPTPHGSWAVAYLVLVAGVAQVGLGLGQALLAPSTPTRRRVAVQIGTWNAGNAGVLVGTLTERAFLVDMGAAVLVVSLVLLVVGVRGGDVEHGLRWRCWALYGFRFLVIVLLLSIPVGLLLARIGPT